MRCGGLLCDMGGLLCEMDAWVTIHVRLVG